MSDAPKKPTYEINLNFSGVGKFSGEVKTLARIRNTPLYIVSLALVPISAFAGLFLDPIIGGVVGLIFGVIGFFISPYAEKTLERIREF